MNLEGGRAIDIMTCGPVRKEYRVDPGIYTSKAWATLPMY